MLIIIMARPKKHRKVNCNPGAYYFKPRGIPMRFLESILLSPDEIEAIHLADYKNLSQDDAAKVMAISRATFGRIIRAARNKIARAIIDGKAIEITK
jgi:predicted DNA-binding protein (UPF0251 family)